MIHSLLQLFTTFAITIISGLGYPGITLTMALGSACVPLPAEAILPFSGYLVSQGRFTLGGIVLAGFLGALLGSWVSYAAGYWGHERLVRRFIRKYGRWIFLDEHKLNVAEQKFKKFGHVIIFVSRFIPGARAIVSLPAGIARVDFKKFVVFTAVGSFLSSLLLGWVGVKLGDNWENIGPYFRQFDTWLVVLGGVGIAGYIWYKLKSTPAGDVQEKLE